MTFDRRRFVLPPWPRVARFVVGPRDRSPAVFNVSVTWWAIIRCNTLPGGLARRVGGRRPPTEISSTGRFGRQMVTFGTTRSRPIIRGIVSDYARLCGISVQAFVVPVNTQALHHELYGTDSKLTERIRRRKANVIECKQCASAARDQ